MIENKVYATPKVGMKIQVKGPLDLDKVYKTVKEYVLITKRYDVTEKKYEQKDKPHGKEIDIIIESEREISKYMIFRLIFSVVARKVFPKDGIYEGEFDMRVVAFLELDYKHLWKPWGFSNFLLKVYNNYIIKREVERYKEKLYKEAIELQDKIRDITK